MNVLKLPLFKIYKNCGVLFDKKINMNM